MYMGARHYMGGIGRFLSVDPAFLSVRDEQKFQERYKRNLQAHLTNPQALNSYSYALNNPLRFKDENGEIAPLVVAGVIWGAAEIGFSIYDGFSTYQTVTDPNTSLGEKSGSVGLFALGLVGPGGGYKTIGSKIDDGVDAVKKLINIKALPAPNKGAIDNAIPSIGRFNLPVNARDAFDRYQKNGWSNLPGHEGGRTFKNRQGYLPKQEVGYYKEWDVNPRERGVSRGSERFVTGQNGEVYYTDTHYGDNGGTPFHRIN